jgi:threonine dehydrogenase-like Zn-dependent dehydrogenase
MKAAVIHNIGDISVDNVPDPIIEQPDDIIVRVTSTAICGSDLHIYDGFVPQLRDEVLGHEFMGIVEETGPQVTKVKKGDRALYHSQLHLVANAFSASKVIIRTACTPILSIMVRKAIC